jgi:hypothetical protein
MQSRSFGLRDMMLIVAAAAIGMVATRYEWEQISGRWWYKNVRPYEQCQTILMFLSPYIALWTVSLLIMRLIPPRPTLKRIGRQPGTVAAVAACAVLILIAGWLALTTYAGILMYSTMGYEYPSGRGMGSGFLVHGNRIGSAIVAYGDRIAVAVAGAWIALAASGRWRPERSWIDQLGRAVGWVWIVFGVLLWCRAFLLL